MVNSRTGSVTCVFDERMAMDALRALVQRGTKLQWRLVEARSELPKALVDPKRDEARRHAPVLLDFRYLKCPDLYEERIRASETARALDEEFNRNASQAVEKCVDVFRDVSDYFEEVLIACGKAEVRDVAKRNEGNDTEKPTHRIWSSTR